MIQVIPFSAHSRGSIIRQEPIFDMAGQTSNDHIHSELDGGLGGHPETSSINYGKATSFLFSPPGQLAALPITEVKPSM